MSILLSGMVIFTTIQAQDYPDTEGDAASGRITFPIYAPELSRIVTLLAMVAWSLILSWFWNIGILSQSIFTALGIFVGIRYYIYRTPAADKRSYVLFNVRCDLSRISVRDQIANRI